MRSTRYRKIFTGLMTLAGFFIILSSHHLVISSSYASENEQQYLFQLSYDDAAQAIGKALAEKGAGAKVSATINGDSTQPLFSYSKPISVEIRGLRYEKPSRWSANLLFIADGNVVSAIPVGGRYQEMITALVLNREVRNGDVIGKDDLETRDFPISRTRADTITDPAKLIGKTPIMAISPSRPIRESEIANPSIVKRNGVVTMRFISPGIEITTTGQAMQDGAKGDVIDVRNTVSRKIVRATIADANTVDIVNPGGAYAAN